ncbi:homoserine dehydrogenase [Pusillimonas sp. CC-YST705]|uniref:Homoserine dehydrogenase n=1 Tax=Mesopusillimonas faecipullorum TaxID=2755040 RepID=A0ABS8C821_9BURK|nr:homoserine dehydrogenase [Mesopusillimonas faecipullorum]MCB5362156.1 homoserine dehydrogenase [Mesopusillimonas faecipullorum]
MKVMKVGLLGLGVVGEGTWKLLRSNMGELERRTGVRIEVTQVAVRDLAKARAKIGDAVPLTQDGLDVVRSPDVDVVVELMGGLNPAYDWVMEAIAQGKHVVTANKALLAERGNEIFQAAREKGVIVAFEAAVAGGIPVVKALREGLTANHIQWVAGIINGTTNFILSEMRTRGLTFKQALAEAQELGYAEADPTFDVEGIDAAHKLTLLASLAFGIPVPFGKAHAEGISDLTRKDVANAERLGYRIKLLGITRRTEKGIELRVHPTLIPAESLLANVSGAMNAVLVNGDAVGSTLYYGAGAGQMPTASAVVADLVDVARMASALPDHQVPHLGFQAAAMANTPILSMSDVYSAYYLRLRVKDRPGVLAELAGILAEEGISIGSMVQEPHGDEEADIIFLLHRALEGNVDRALERIQSLGFVKSKVIRLRMETEL